MNTSGRKVILYVEDEAILRKLIHHTFKHRDYEIIEAADGAEAIQVAREKLPDLILMDMQLPKVSGFDATRAIRQLPALRDIPIIALTGFALAEEEHKAREAGCDHYVTKPFDTDNILDLVDGLLRP